MRAVTWYGADDVRVEQVPEPRVVNPRDAVVRVSSTTICGSDLHMFDGYTPTMGKGDILGHEVIGEIVQVGEGITDLHPGDRVVAAFAIACGRCHFCQQGLFSLCDNSNPNAPLAEQAFGHSPAGLLGYTHLTGGYAGGQAEFVRIPYADVGLLKVPGNLRDEQLLPLADILPTGYQAAEQCQIRPGDTVAVWGCGAVGQMAIKSAYLLGAERVIAIDRLPERLAMAREQGGAETIHFQETDVLDALKEMTAGRGPDACIEAVGMESTGRTLDALMDRARQAIRMETGRPHALRQAIMACRKGGTISIPGVFVGMVDMVPMGAAFNKGLTFRMGQTNVQKYWHGLLERIVNGEIDPSYVFTHTVALDQAPDAYRMFRDKREGVVKIVLKPRITALGSEQRQPRELEMANTRSMPSQAEGDRATVEESLRQRGLSAEGAQTRTEAMPAEGTPPYPDLPSQAEGERSTIDENLLERGAGI
jgi:threonine dehydrogenase-like Zn-dependent dehydrogenase